MNHLEIAALKGREGSYKTGELNVSVKIIDAKWAFGRVDVLITPLAGSGEQWVRFDKITMN